MVASAWLPGKPIGPYRYEGTRDLELLVAKIQQQLAPKSEVIHNARLDGRLSQTSRQIDVLVRDRIGQFEMNIVIDAKDYARPVDVKGVEMLVETWRRLTKELGELTPELRIAGEGPLENKVREGGFALITGDPGTGKSVVLPLLAERLARVRDLTVGALTHPQSHVADFYRELGDLFAVALNPHNRWNGFKTLRERWRAHLDSTLLRPVLLIDEAQEMPPVVLSELRLLAPPEVASGQRAIGRVR
jgi:hypothetical protein